MRKRRANGSNQLVALNTQRRLAFNKGDEKAGVATCASPASVVDDFAPHLWQGPTACADWAKAFDAEAAREGMTDGIVTIGTPRHDEVTGNVAYVVVPATFAYKLKGKPVVERGNVFTAVLKKTSAGWHIAAWTWAKG